VDTAAAMGRYSIDEMIGFARRLARVSDDHGFLIASPLVRRHIEAGLSV